MEFHEFGAEERNLNWEQSGKGDGRYTGEDDDEEKEDDYDGNDDGEYDDEDATKRFGSFAGHSKHALYLHRNFFDDKNTYLLYLWDFLDEHDLGQSTMQQLL